MVSTVRIFCETIFDAPKRTETMQKVSAAAVQRLGQ